MINGDFSYSLGRASAWATSIILIAPLKQYCQYTEHPRSLTVWQACFGGICVEVHLALLVCCPKNLGEKILVATQAAASLTQLQQLHSDSLPDASAPTRHYCNLMFEQARFENTGERHAGSWTPLGLWRTKPLASSSSRARPKWACPTAAASIDMRGFHRFSQTG